VGYEVGSFYFLSKNTTYFASPHFLKRNAMKTELILVKNGLIELPEAKSKKSLDVSILGTVFNNLAYYGFVLSKEATNRLMKLTDTQVKEWWTSTEHILKEVTGASKNMDKYVVYKNFPQEVCDMGLCEYWVKQIFMYIGCPNEYFTESEVTRDKMFEKIELKVLQLAKADSLQTIYTGLLKNPARWTNEQFGFVRYFVVHQKLDLNVKLIPFKENLVTILAEVMTNNLNVKISSATDLLRLGVALSDGDVTFKTNSKFKSLSRPHRKFLLGQLENCSNLEEDVARDRNRWKKFLRSLHPGDYAKTFPKVNAAYDKLYNDEVHTFNSSIEELLLLEDANVLTLLNRRPGDFVRRLNKLVEVFGPKAVNAFVKILPKLKTIQLLKIQKYILTIDNRLYLTFAPKGNWTKLKVVPNEKKFPVRFQTSLNDAINDELAARLNKEFKNGVILCDRTEYVKLQTNDSDLIPYGRGTVFEIPDNINFIRSASYWKNAAWSSADWCNLWYDNGWNFFNADWKNVGNVCWNAVKFGKNASVFSGDPTSTKDVDGNACQMIDLYIDKLLAEGVRYAVWNILCFNHMSFNKSEVFAALQWGEEAQKGKLFEPSRCQMCFPLKGDNMTKYIAYFDLKERKLVYIDANLKGQVNSAVSNGKTLETVMPAYVECLNTIPTVHDLFKNVKQKKGGTPATPILYTDEGFEINGGNAYVFKPLNKENKYKQLSLPEYL
jgi:hypothetical protein